MSRQSTISSFFKPVTRPPADSDVAIGQGAAGTAAPAAVVPTTPTEAGRSVSECSSGGSGAQIDAGGSRSAGKRRRSSATPPPRRKRIQRRRIILSDDEDDSDDADAGDDSGKDSDFAAPPAQESSSSSDEGVDEVADEEDEDDDDDVAASPAARRAAALSSLRLKRRAPTASPVVIPARKRARASPATAATPISSPSVRLPAGAAPSPSTSTPFMFNSAKAAIAAQQDVESARPKKYTELEKQVLEIRKRYPDTLLMVEVGYKYRFFGEDAAIASRVLSIWASMQGNFLSASIPVIRKDIHLRRLVEAGHRVALVRQTDTRAIKAAEAQPGQRSRGFARDVEAVYSAATLVDDGEDAREASNAGARHYAARSRWLMAVMLDAVPSDASEAELVRMHVAGGVVAIDMMTGDLVQDAFTDTYLRTELETRLLAVAPVEVLLPDDVDAATRSAVARACPAARVHCMPAAVLRSREQAAALFATRSSSPPLPSDDGDAAAGQSSDALDSLAALPPACYLAFAALWRYLDDARLVEVLQRRSYDFRSTTDATSMQLNATTLRNLDILRPARGSLFSFLNNCRTAMGARLLGTWLLHPLVQLDALSARHDAVQELLDSGLAAGSGASSSAAAAAASRGVSSCLAPLLAVLRKLPDMERMLKSVLTLRASPGEFVTMAKAMQRVLAALPSLAMLDDDDVGVTSSLLRQLVCDTPADLLQALTDTMDQLDVVAASAGNLGSVFRQPQAYPEVWQQIQELQAVRDGLQQALHAARRALGRPALEYKTVLLDEYMFELPLSGKGAVPSDWSVVGQTKRLIRYRSPAVIDLMRRKDLATERLAVQAADAWRRFLRQFVTQHLHGCQLVLRNVAQLDVLLSFARTALLPGYTRPSMVPEHVLDITDGRHAMAEGSLPGGNSFVPNTVRLASDAQRCLIITGPNMGGKSSLIRQTALIVIMAQIGCYVPAKAARLGIFDSVLTRMGASDDLQAGLSTFMLELTEASRILASATDRSLVILDELGRGTATHDGTAIAHATLEYLATRVRCMTLFVTHYPSLGALAEQYPHTIGTGHMAYLQDDEQRDATAITFLYRFQPGLARRSYGLNVARLAGLQDSLIREAERKARELELMSTMTATRDAVAVLAACVQESDPAASVRDAHAKLRGLCSFLLSSP